MMHFKTTFTTGFIKRFRKYNVLRKRCALSLHNTRVPSVMVCHVFSLGHVETKSSFVCTLYASLPCVQLNFYV